MIILSKYGGLENKLFVDLKEKKMEKMMMRKMRKSVPKKKMMK